MTNIAINGFGRIGRLATRIILDKFENSLNLVAVNTSGSMLTADWAHLFKHDSVYGPYKKEVKVEGSTVLVNGKSISFTGERDPSRIAWQKEPSIILECTGAFRKEQDIRQLLKGSVKKIVLSAPAKNGNVPMFVLGVNGEDYKGEDLVSCASCTTNCVAPIMSILEKTVGVKKALLNTIHAYTSGQRLLDNSHKDLRRARAAAINIVPTSTGAAKATGKIIKSLNGIFDGLAVRVPVAVVSLADIVLVSNKATSQKELNNYFEKSAQNELKGILKASDKPLVSTDIIASNYSSTIDLGLTNVIENDLVRVVAWYDNEWGYTNRLVELALKVSN